MSKAKDLRAEIFLVAFAAVLLEIAYTRVLSFKLYYYFTFLTIGIALLGLGSGGVLVSVLPRLRRAAPERVMAGCGLAGALVVPAGYLLIARVQANVTELAEKPLEVLTLALLCAALALPFLVVGVALAAVFSARPEQIGRLYAADLVGAALACVLCIPVFALVGPPGAVLVAGAALGLVTLRTSGTRLLSATGTTLALVLVGLAVIPNALPDPVTDRDKTMSPQQMGAAPPLHHSEWGPVFRVDVSDSPMGKENLLLIHDGNVGANIIRFDGDLSRLSRLDADARAFPFAVLDPGPEVLVIGAAGGHEVLASLYFGASRITAVELNPVTVSLLRGEFADYSGRIAEHERVRFLNDEGRSFLRRDESRYDLIWLVAPDSYAAMNAASSSAFVLSESYLYTQEMIQEAFRHLRPGGFLCLQTGDIDFARKPNRAARFLSTARAALAGLGIRDFERHVLVASTREFFTLVTIMLSPDPISPEQSARFSAAAARIMPVGDPSTVWHPPAAAGPPEQVVQRVVRLPDAALERWRESYPYDISAVSDAKPFFWHFASFRDAWFRAADATDYVYDPEDAKGERVLGAVLLFAVVFAGSFLLLPLALARDAWRLMPHKPSVVAYFAALGLGFMFYEVCLIQRFTLFLGYPTYSLTVTLFALLVFSGLGSLWSERLRGGARMALPWLLPVLAVLTLWMHLGAPLLLDPFAGAPLGVRVALVVLALAPLGLLLGTFMPLGLTAVAGLGVAGREYVAWAWAVNGFFSVVSSVLATMLSMTWGFGFVLWLALAVYGAGAVALWRVIAPLSVASRP